MKPLSTMRWHSMFAMVLLAVLGFSRGWAAQPTDGPIERGQFSQAVTELWQTGDFESLERMSNELRTKKLKFSEGIWKLAEFYGGVGHSIGAGNAGFEAAEKQVKVWREKFPKSITAPIVEAEILTEHAWFFRGGGYASEVADSGWTNFSRYLSEARKVLEEAKTQSSVCPGWYEAMLHIGPGQSWKKAEFEEVFEAGVKIAPDYYGLYFRRAWSLLPQWFGAEGEWQAFAQAQAALHDPAIYARIVWAQSVYFDAKKFFTEGKASWPLMKAGFEKMLKDYPDSTWNRSMFCKFACQADDRATAKKLFKQLGDNRHPNAWKNAKEFQKWKTWANASE